MQAKVTRRAAAAALVGGAPLLAAQAPAAATAQTPDELLKNAKEQVRRNAEQLAKIEVPIELEPSFVFKP